MEYRTLIDRIEMKNDLKIEILETIREMRGVKVLKIEINNKQFALKILDKSKIVLNKENDSSYRILSLVRESNILENIKNDFNYHYLNGDDFEYTWLITNWIDGENAKSYLNKLKLNPNNGNKSAKIIQAIQKIIQRFSILHKKGILHGDVQPAHIIFDSKNEVQLLDFGLAKTVLDENFVYKGGLVHFNAPEIAREMLLKSENIKLDILSEIYSLGSVLFYIYTGYTSTNYESIDFKSVPFETKLNFIVEGNRNTFKSAGAENLNNLEEILNRMMEFNRDKRSNDLKTVLEQIILNCN
jgi:serine/threonine protein kinase